MSLAFDKIITKNICKLPQNNFMMTGIPKIMQQHKTLMENWRSSEDKTQMLNTNKLQAVLCMAVSAAISAAIIAVLIKHML